MKFIIDNCKLSMTSTIYILLGANLGDPISQIEKAKDLLKEKIGNIIAESSIYESEAWGVEDQPIFYNQVICFETNYEPLYCLKLCQEIELHLGRIRSLKWGARLIDIDILYYNEDIIDEKDLKIPHPYIQFRNFTLIPLVEIAPDYMHPILNVTNKQLLTNSEDKLTVKLIS